MANVKNPPPVAPAQSAEEMVKVRVKTEIYGSWRDPQAKRGDIIEITRGEFEKAGPHCFEDLAATEREQKHKKESEIINHGVERERERLRADRDSSYRAHAMRLRQQADAALKQAEEMEKRLKAG